MLKLKEPIAKLKKNERTMAAAKKSAKTNRKTKKTKRSCR